MRVADLLNSWDKLSGGVRRDTFNRLSTWLSDARSVRLLPKCCAEEHFRTSTAPGTVLYLVGNSELLGIYKRLNAYVSCLESDMESERQVSYEEASQFALENGPSFLPLCGLQLTYWSCTDMVFIETSAKSGQQVDDCFHGILPFWCRVSHSHVFATDTAMSILERVQSGR
jgi:hypothetical protein